MPTQWHFTTSPGKSRVRCTGFRSALFRISSGLAWLGVWYGTRLHLALYRPDSRSVSDSYSGRLVSKLSSARLGHRLSSYLCSVPDSIRLKTPLSARLGSAQIGLNSVRFVSVLEALLGSTRSWALLARSLAWHGSGPG